LLPGGKNFNGKVEVDFKLLSEIKKGDDPEWAFLDYKGAAVTKIVNNGRPINIIGAYKDERIYLNPENLKVGEMNKIVINFESSYVRDC
jgi:hypothetical protein